jgi:hypothetical protein
VPWRLTVRAEHRVERSRFDDLPRALDALERRGRELARTAPRKPVDVKIKQFEPVQQVIARLELAGPERWLPSVRAGVDVRGDGSSEAYRGGMRRQLLEPRRGEDAFGVLRSALANVLKAAGSDAP